MELFPIQPIIYSSNYITNIRNTQRMPYCCTSLFVSI